MSESPVPVAELTAEKRLFAVASQLESLFRELNSQRKKGIKAISIAGLVACLDRIYTVVGLAETNPDFGEKVLLQLREWAALSIKKGG